MDECPLDTDCVGEWSKCSSSCETAGDRDFIRTKKQSGKGKSCEYEPPVDCEAGMDECPLDTDCVGEWSKCSSSCETAGDRDFIRTKKQSGKGKSCAPSVDCKYGDGKCPNALECVGRLDTCSDSCEIDGGHGLIIYSYGNEPYCQSIPDCKDGDEECPPGVDCTDRLSMCTDPCSVAGKRRLEIYRTELGQGTHCR
jgi:hypothetical protein